MEKTKKNVNLLLIEGQCMAGNDRLTCQIYTDYYLILYKNNRTDPIFLR